MARRLFLLFGLGCAGLGAYLAYWGGYEGWRWAANLLMGVPLFVLPVARRMGRTSYDVARLKAKVGAAQVDRLSIGQVTAMVLAISAGLVGYLLPPAFSDVPARHVVMQAALAGVVAAGVTGAWVEVRYRALLIQAGMLRPGS